MTELQKSNKQLHSQLLDLQVSITNIMYKNINQNNEEVNYMQVSNSAASLSPPKNIAKVS